MHLKKAICDEYSMNPPVAYLYFTLYMWFFHVKNANGFFTRIFIVVCQYYAFFATVWWPYGSDVKKLHLPLWLAWQNIIFTIYNLLTYLRSIDPFYSLHSHNRYPIFWLNMQMTFTVGPILFWTNIYPRNILLTSFLLNFVCARQKMRKFVYIQVGRYLFTKWVRKCFFDRNYSFLSFNLISNVIIL